MSIPNRDYSKSDDMQLRLEESGLPQDQATAIACAIREATSDLVTQDYLKEALDRFTKRLTILLAMELTAIFAIWVLALMWMTK